jgi:hypothetical protein
MSANTLDPEIDARTTFAWSGRVASAPGGNEHDQYDRLSAAHFAVLLMNLIGDVRTGTAAAACSSHK